MTRTFPTISPRILSRALRTLLFAIAVGCTSSILASCAGDDSPRFALCGNGVVDPGELCDDGNLNDDDSCLSTCVPARCGDGFVARFSTTAPEECDGLTIGNFCVNRLPERVPCRSNADCARGGSPIPGFPNPCQRPTCAAFGLGTGVLVCTRECRISVDSCGPPPSPTPTPLPPTSTPRRTPRTPRTPTP